MSEWLTRCGRIAFKGERTVWLHGSAKADFTVAVPLVRALQKRFKRLDYFFTSEDTEVRAWLAGAFPDAVVAPPPWPLGHCVEAYLLNVNVRCLLLLGDADRMTGALLRRIRHRQIPLVLVQARSGSGTLRKGLLDYCEHCFAEDATARRAFVAAGLPEQQVSVVEAEDETGIARLAAVVGPLLMRDLKLLRSEARLLRRALEGAAMWCLEHPRLGRWLTFKAERIDNIEALNDRLGHPDTILCLGNGPTSESDALRDLPHDCLFRVNHLWLKRGFLAKPDVVFTNSKPAVSKVKNTIFGILSMRSEARLLVTGMTRLGGGTMRFITLERTGLDMFRDDWTDLRPTNGAVMLATAVLLQPKRLVVAGIDLFSHPAGSYPGDQSIPNAYSPAHEADFEVDYMMRSLQAFRGELVILSPALEERWQAFKATGGGESGRDQPEAPSIDLAQGSGA